MSKQKSPIYFRWSREMRRSDLGRPGERVGIAVSGGPDSVLLLEFMKQLARERGFTLAVVHFNHRLRGRDSDEDECFVESCARDSGLEFIASAADVLAVARVNRRNLEETARQLRYEFFISLINQGRLDRVATGHTANDQAETVLLRLVRGSGTRGIGGIYPNVESGPTVESGSEVESGPKANSGPKVERGIIRPFLGLTRREIEEEIAVRGLKYRADATNLDTRFARNKVRLELLPWLAREMNPNIVKSLNAFAALARDDESYLERETAQQLRHYRTGSKGEQRIPVRVLSDLHPAVAKRFVRRMIADVRGSLRGITHTHIEDVCALAAGSQSGKQLHFRGVTATEEFDSLVLTRALAPTAEAQFSYPIRLPCRVDVPALRVVFRLEIITECERKGRYNHGAETGLTIPMEIDPRKLSPHLTFRSWRPGDRFHPWGTQNPAKLKDLLRQRRIPAGERRLWPVLQSGADIVWVRGLPPASFAMANVQTAEWLIITEEPWDRDRPEG